MSIIYKYKQPSLKVFDAISFKPSITWSNKTQGKYILTVRTLDQNGLQGKVSNHAFNLGFETTDQLKIPSLNTPTNNYQTVTHNPTLHWFNVAGAIAYRVQISNSADFSILLYVY